MTLYESCLNYDVSRSMVQHNRDFYRLVRGGVPVQVPGCPGTPEDRPVLG